MRTSPARPSNTGASNRNLRQQHGACCPPSTSVLGLCVQPSNRTNTETCYTTRCCTRSGSPHNTTNPLHTHMDSSNSHIAHPHPVTQHTCHGQIDALLFVFGTNPSPKEFRQDDTCNKSFCGHTQHRNGSITKRKYEWPTTTSILDV